MQQLERNILDWIQQNLRYGALDTMMLFVSRISDHGEVWLILTAALMVNRRHRGTGITLAITLLLELICCNMLLKPMFGRLRPFAMNGNIDLILSAPLDYSFPSGLTAVAFAVVTPLLLSGSRFWKPTGILSLLYEFSSLSLYVLWSSEFLGGLLLGILLRFAC